MRMKARSDVEVLIEYLRPAKADGKGPAGGLEVVQEEPPGVLAELARDPAAGCVHGREHVAQLVGERGLRHRALADAEHLDRAAQGRVLVLVQRPDHVVGRREVFVAVEPAPGQRHQVRRIQLGVLAVDRDEELDDLVGRQVVEDDRRNLEVLEVVLFGELVEREEAVLPVEGPQDAGLIRQLERARVGAAARGGELESLLRDEEHAARDRRQRPGVGALEVVGDQLVDLLLDDRALEGMLGGRDLPSRGTPS